MEDSFGRAKGGKARSEKLSPEQRSEIAKKGGEARWKERITSGDMPKIVEGHSGSIKIGALEIPCAIITGENGVGVRRVVSETGLATAILGSRSGASIKSRREALESGRAPMPVFLTPKNIQPFINIEIHGRALTPIEYVDASGRIYKSYEAEVIPLVCDIWLRAREAGVLQKQQLGRAQRAEILLRATAQVGIVALVDEATGYQSERPIDALQDFLSKLIRKELAAWMQRFPEEFFENIYKLRGWTWPGMKKNRYSIVGHYIKDIVYERLAPGVLKELEDKNPKNDKGQRKSKHHQWLTDDVGHPMLAQHMQTILTLQRLAIAQGYGWKRFMQSVDMVSPKKGEQLHLPMGL